MPSNFVILVFHLLGNVFPWERDKPFGLKEGWWLDSLSDSVQWIVIWLSLSVLFDLSFFHNLFICSCNVFVPIPAVWISQMFTPAEQCIKFHVVLQWIVLNGIQNTIYLHMRGMTRINIRLMKVNFWDCSLSLLLYCSNLYFLFQVFSEYMALRTHEIRERHRRSWRASLIYG